MQPEDDLKTTLKQGSIIPTIKTFPVLFRCVGKANPSLATDGKLDDLGVPELFLLPGRFEGLLKHQFANSETFVSLGISLVFTPAHSVGIRGLYVPFHVRRTGMLKHVMSAHPIGGGGGANLELG